MVPIESMKRNMTFPMPDVRVRMPEVHRPEVDLPRYRMPEMPRFRFQFRVPWEHVPEVRRPDFEVPRFQMPRFHFPFNWSFGWPSFEVPRVHVSVRRKTYWDDMPSWAPFAAAAFVGAMLAYFFDPVSGKRRRVMTFDRVSAFFRHGARQAGRMGRAVGAEGYGAYQKVSHMRPVPKNGMDDVTLAHKVEAEVFRGFHDLKGRINVSAEYGVVVLRGEVDRVDQIEEVELAARRVPEVSDLRNMLHVVGTPAPNTQEAFSGQ